MASLSQDDNVHLEEADTRRSTRSGRKAAATTMPATSPPAARSTRRTRRSHNEPEVDEIAEDTAAVADPAAAEDKAPNNDKTTTLPDDQQPNDTTENGDAGIAVNTDSEAVDGLSSEIAIDANIDENDQVNKDPVDEHTAQLASSSDDDDDRARADDPPNGVSVASNDTGEATLADAEMVSEDELPLLAETAVPAPPPPLADAEEVSDEELPGPRLAELPADTEVVSEDDELEASAVAVADDESPAADGATTNKRKADDCDDGDGAVSADGGGAEKRAREDKIDPMAAAEKPEAAVAAAATPAKKVLPELARYWKAVRDDAADFSGWTYLLQYVDQENDVEAAREAYDAFLGHYPYCYGYWRKYADYEKRKGLKENCEKVFKRGLRAIPLSVDLWIHYLTYVRQLHCDSDPAAAEAAIRAEFERAVEECGLEFRSDKLWEAFIKWETEGGRIGRIVAVYDRLLATPTQGYNGHFDCFMELVRNNPVTSLVSATEFKRIRDEVRGQIGSTDTSTSTTTCTTASTTCTASSADTAPGTATATSTDSTSSSATETGTECMVTELKSDATSSAVADAAADDDLSVCSDEEAAAIRDRILAARRRLHKQTVAAVTARWTFEEGIKRPYFHVKPLERCQLKNWRDYLDFEIAAGDRRRVLVLFERCLIACALYDDFWLKLVRYLEQQKRAADEGGDAEDAVAMHAHIRTVFERACLVHHPDKPALHMLWASFEECSGGVCQAVRVLEALERTSPNLLQVAYRRINLERRRGQLDRAEQLYEEYLRAARADADGTDDAKTAQKARANVASLALKYARFLHRVRDQWERAWCVLNEALAADALNQRLALQAVDLAMQRPGGVRVAEVVAVFDAFAEAQECGGGGGGGVELEQRVAFAQRKVEFLEDFGVDAVQLQEAQRKLQVVMHKANEAKKKGELAPTKKPCPTKDTATNAAAAAAAAAAYGANYAAPTGPAAAGYYAQLPAQQQPAYGYADNGGGYASYQQQQQQWQQYGSTTAAGVAANGVAYTQQQQWGGGGYY